MDINESNDERPPLVEEVIHVEIEIIERVETLTLPDSDEVVLMEQIREKLELPPEIHFFERGKEAAFTHHAKGRKHIRLVGHHCQSVKLLVQYDHLDKVHHFPPATTVSAAAQWAVGKQAYNLDPIAAAKANLILLGADQPLPKEDVLGKYVKAGQCELVVSLTLKDFTNG